MKENPDVVIKYWNKGQLGCAVLITAGLLYSGILWRDFFSTGKIRNIIFGFVILFLPWSPFAFSLLKLRAIASVSASVASMFYLVNTILLLSGGSKWGLAVVPLPFAVLYCIASIKTWHADEVVWLKAARPTD